MNKYKEKIGDILNKIKGNKRILYLTFCIVLILSCLVLNVTFAKYTDKTNKQEANIIIGDLKYKMVINEVNLDESVGIKMPTNTIIGDRIIHLKSGATERFDIALTSLNNIDTKYEIIYNVCSDENCTSFIDTPESVFVFLHGDSEDSERGDIAKQKLKNISLVTQNFEEDDYYVQISLNCGYNHNALRYYYQINQTYGINGTIGSGNLSLIAYVDGKKVSSFPLTNNYNATVICNGGNTVGSAKWNGTKWIISITNMDTAGMICKVGFTSTNTPAPIGWFTAEEDTLIYAIRTANPVSTSSIIKGESVSGASEKILAASEDDYGTSYYFRGSIDNNFVVFAGMCFRVVRINGDGSIRMTLYNRNDNSLANPCNEKVSNGAFAKYDGTKYTSAFNTFHGDDMHSKAQMVGFMYGTTNNVGYTEGHANIIESAILTNLKKWYDLKLRDYDSYLADVIYCNDKSGNGNMNYTAQFNSYSRIASYYGGTAFSIPGGTGASLVCPLDNNGGKLSKFTSSDTENGNGNLRGSNGVGTKDYKIGLLNSDEVALAGGAVCPDDAVKDNYALSSTSYYLYENASSNYWWTMSPHSHPYTNGIAVSNDFAVGTNGMLYGKPVSETYGVRPAISLIYDTKISSGTGTATDPYVVS